VTDTTLATELLLLDRCIESLREARPARAICSQDRSSLAARHQRYRCIDKVLTLVGHFLRDAGASVAQPDVGIGDPRRLAFRPSMGWLNIR